MHQDQEAQEIPGGASIEGEQHGALSSVIRRSVADSDLGVTTSCRTRAATGPVCGGLALRIGGMISPAYAAILGTLVAYPALVAVWRRVPRPGKRSR